MYFGGNNFTYLSKRKLQKVEKLKNPDLYSLKQIKEEPENLESSIQKQNINLRHPDDFWDDITISNIPNNSNISPILTSNNISNPNIANRNLVDAKTLNTFNVNIENEVIRGRKKESPSKLKDDSKSRSSSDSYEKNKDEELDEVYMSEDEEDDDDSISPNKIIQSQKQSMHHSIKKDNVKQPLKSLDSKGERRVKYNLAKMKKSGQKVYKHKVDTNILTIKFAFLSDKIGYATGDPTFCKNCNSILNANSKLTWDKETEESTWVCEFCNFANKLQIEKEEVPKSNQMDYFIMSKNHKSKSGLSYSDDKTIIFCFDVSGSMCVTTPVTGKHKFKGSTIDKEMQELLKFTDGTDQSYYNKVNQDKTYISRMQCLQAAIESNLTLMKETAPNVKIGFVTFNNEVVGIGDGTQQEVKINGNNLNDAEFIKLFGKNSCDIIKKPIKETFDYLLKHLYSIQENGQTALGPAILFAINLLQGVTSGSKIILCTDGISNIGISSIEGVTRSEDIESLNSFYKEVGKQAKDNGIIISLITFEGEESKIEILSNLAKETGGDIIRVKPSQILEQFSNLLTTEIVATNVKLNIKLHKLLKFRNEKKENLKDDNSTLVKDIGNVTNETELYVEYQFKRSKDIYNMKDVDITKLTTVPFQSIIYYTSKIGDHCIRVLTNSQKISSEKEEVSKQALYDLISVNAIQKTSLLAQEGKYREAQSNALAWKKLMRNNISDKSEEAYEMFNKNMNKFNNMLQRAQVDEYESKMSKNSNDKEYLNNFSHNIKQSSLPFSTDSNYNKGESYGSGSGRGRGSSASNVNIERNYVKERDRDRANDQKDIKFTSYTYKNLDAYKFDSFGGKVNNFNDSGKFGGYTNEKKILNLEEDHWEDEDEETNTEVQNNRKQVRKDDMSKDIYCLQNMNHSKLQKKKNTK